MNRRSRLALRVQAWVMGMCQGRRCQAHWLYFLLIAVAIQGVTPDSARPCIHHTLDAALSWPWLTRGTLADKEALPDEVCGPAQARDRPWPCGAGLEPYIGPMSSLSIDQHVPLRSAIKSFEILPAGTRRITGPRRERPAFIRFVDFKC